MAFRIYSNVDFDISLVDASSHNINLLARSSYLVDSITASIERARLLKYLTYVQVANPKIDPLTAEADQVIPQPAIPSDALPEPGSSVIPAAPIGLNSTVPVPSPTDPLVIFSVITRTLLFWRNGVWTDSPVDPTPEEPMPVPQYTVLTDQVTDDLMYVGEALPGSAKTDAAWRIKRVSSASDGDTSIEWAQGTANFDKAWSDRTTLTYQT
jgi:hypothetical protein